MSGAAEDAGAVHRRENRWAGRARSTRLRAVLPLAEIHRLARTVDGDRRSPVADAASAPWDHPAGTARW